MSEFDWHDEKIGGIYCRLCGKALCGYAIRPKDGVLIILPCPCVADNRDDWKSRCSLSEKMMSLFLGWANGEINNIDVFKEKFQRVFMKWERLKNKMEGKNEPEQGVVLHSTEHNAAADTVRE